MGNIQYAKVYTEVMEIISHLPREEYLKIPKNQIKFYTENMDKEYVYKIDPEIELSKQNISKETNAILITIFRDYFATDKQKDILNSLLKQNQDKVEKIKQEKYNYDEIFKDRKTRIKEDEINKKEDTSLIKYKESFFIRFKRFILHLLNKE